MPDYSTGKIYTIRCRTDPTLVYVGSTLNPLYKRLGHHKTRSRIECERLLYKTINNNWDDWYIELYENFACNSIEELRQREGQVIREIGNLNKKIEGRTPKEYNSTPERKEANRTYKQGEEYKARQNIKIECGCGGQYANRHKNRHEQSKKHQEWEKQKQPEM